MDDTGMGLGTLAPWQIILITVAAAIVLGVIIGMIVGKIQVKKASGAYKPVLSLKERIVYLAMFLVGTACVLFGVFYSPGADGVDMVEGGMYEDGMMGGEGMMEGAVDVTIDGGDQNPIDDKADVVYDDAAGAAEPDVQQPADEDADATFDANQGEEAAGDVPTDDSVDEPADNSATDTMANPATE